MERGIDKGLMLSTNGQTKEATMPYDKLAKLGFKLPPPPAPGGNYVPYVINDDTVYLSGQGPLLDDGSLAKGKVGDDVTTEQAIQHAQRCTLALLAVLEQAAGSLERVDRIVKVFGMVNGVADFREHPRVIDGCSSLLLDVFGERGRHARSAIGMGSLPHNITVEIELVAKLGKAP